MKKEPEVMKNTEMVKREEANVPMLQRDKPAFLNKEQGQGSRGLEDLDRQDMVLPRLQVCQTLSPQRKASSTNYIMGLQEGDLFNSVTAEIYGKIANVSPLLFWKSRIYFTPVEEGGGILCQSANGKTGGVLHPDSCETCGHAKWGQARGESPDCTIFYNYACILLPRRELVVVSLKTSGIKVAKQWNSLMRLRNADSFAGMYELTPVVEKSGNNEWYTFKVQPAGWVDESTYRFCEAQYAALKGENLRVDTSHLDDFDEPGANDEV